MLTRFRIYAVFSRKDKVNLEKYGLTVDIGFSDIRIFGNNGYFDKIVEYCKNLDKYYISQGMSLFTSNEIESASTIMLRWQPEEFPNPVGDTRYERMEKIYGKICKQCDTPLHLEQINPVHFRRLPELKSKRIAFTCLSLNNIWFTDKDRYERIFKKWGFKHLPVLIGKEQKISPNFVQLVPEFSPVPLAINGTAYAETFDLNVNVGLVGNYPPCSCCNQYQYTSNSKDYFIPFEQEFDFDFIYTREWFGGYHHIVISNKFYRYLADIKLFKYKNETDFLVPVRLK